MKEDKILKELVERYIEFEFNGGKKKFEKGEGVKPLGIWIETNEWCLLRTPALDGTVNVAHVDKKTKKVTYLYRCRFDDMCCSMEEDRRMSDGVGYSVNEFSLKFNYDVRVVE